MSLYKNIVPKMANDIPPAATKFPFLAVAGFDNILSPSIKVTEAIK